MVFPGGGEGSLGDSTMPRTFKGHSGARALAAIRTSFGRRERFRYAFRAELGRLLGRRGVVSRRYSTGAWQASGPLSLCG
ncbi:hypothetical protein AERO9AM_11049 [Aeromicrobium sp. 9AM]|nr:hypothetical protein AERO9AM_11049 [Aeromicrobium sp. 9AM]